MALPVLSKTWELVPNQIVPSQAQLTFNQETLLLIKNTLIGFTNNPWTVVGSSNASVAAMDAVDRWVVNGDIIASTGAHSWIVLQRVDGAQLLISCDNSNHGRLIFGWSASGTLAGGTTTVDPTSVDVIGVDGATVSAPGLQYWNGNQGSGTPTQDVYHFWHSTDGLITRIAECKAGKVISWWRFETIKNPRATHTNNPTFAGIFSSSSSANEQPSVSIAEDTGMGNTEKDGTGIGVRLLSAGLGNGNVNYTEKPSAAIAEEWDGELWCTEEHFFCETVGSRGPKGQSYDFWWGLYQIASTGDTFPNTPLVREFVILGPFVLVWTGDATIPQVA